MHMVIMDTRPYKPGCALCTMWGKKLHRFIFATALSELHLLLQFLAYI